MDESFLRLVIILCTTTIIFIISCCWGFVFSPKERKNHIIGIYVIIERNKSEATSLN